MDLVHANSHRKLLIAGLVAGFIVLAWIRTVRLVEDNARRDVTTQLETIRATSDEALSVWLDAQLGIARAWADSSAVTRATEELLGVEDGDAERVRDASRAQLHLGEVLLPVLDAEEYEAFFVVARDGRNLASSDRELVGARSHLLADEDFFNGVLSGQVRITTSSSSSHLLPAAQKPGVERYHAFVGAPLRDANERVIGVLVFRVDLRRELSRILGHGRLGETGETYCIDAQAHMVSVSRFESSYHRPDFDSSDISPRHIAVRAPGVDLREEPLPRQIELSTLPLTRSARAVVSGESGVDTNAYADYRGVPVVGSWIWHEQLGLGVIVEQDALEAFASSMTTKRALHLLFVVLLTLLAWGSFVTIRANRRNVALFTKLQLRSRQLQESAAFNNRIFETSPVGKAICRMDGTLISVNPAYAKIIGRTIDESLELSYWEITPETYAEQEAEALRSLEETGKYAVYEKEYIHADGHLVPVRLSGMIVRHGDEDVIWSVVEDLGAEADANRKRRELERLIEAIQAGVIVHDSDGSILAANPTAERILGLTAEQMMGKTTRDPRWTFIDEAGEELDPEDYPVTRVLREGEPLHNMTLGVFRPETNDMRWAQVNGIPMFVDGGLHQVIITFTDITELVESQEGNTQLLGELRKRNAEMERFVYTVSHDLKSPLITIHGFIGLAESDLDEGDLASVREDHEHIASAAKTMKALLDDLLELSRLGRVVNEPTEFGLFELATEVSQLLHGVTARVGIEVRIARDLPVVLADRSRMLEVLQNLIENAAKYMGEQPEPIIEVGTGCDDEGLFVYVRDNGVGIKPEFHHKVFGLFEQLTPGAGGTGVGLALVARIIELHNGHIWIESEGDGSGATFCLRIPGMERQRAEGGHDADEA